MFYFKCMQMKTKVTTKRIFLLNLTGVALTADTKIQRMPSESAAQSLAVALPSSQARYEILRF